MSCLYLSSRHVKSAVGAEQMLLGSFEHMQTMIYVICRIANRLKSTGPEVHGVRRPTRSRALAVDFSAVAQRQHAGVCRPVVGE